MALLRGDVPTTEEKHHEGAAIARELGDDAIVGRFLEAEGYLAFMGDDLGRARPLLEESLALAERRGDRMAIAVSHHTVAQVARLDGRFDDAAAHYREALRFGHELGDAAAMSEPLQGLAAVAIATGAADRGVRLLAANDAIRERLGGGPPPEWLRLGDPLADARRSLGDDAYQLAWDAGRKLTFDEAFALGRQQRGYLFADQHPRAGEGGRRWANGCHRRGRQLVLVDQPIEEPYQRLVPRQDGGRAQAALIQRHDEGLELIRLQIGHPGWQALRNKERLQLGDGRRIRAPGGCRPAVGGEVPDEGLSQVVEIGLVGGGCRLVHRKISSHPYRSGELSTV